MRTVNGFCPHCDTNTLAFDFGGTVSGPGIFPYPEVNELVKQECDCVLTPEDVERARVAIVEDPEGHGL